MKENKKNDINVEGLLKYIYIYIYIKISEEMKR